MLDERKGNRPKPRGGKMSRNCLEIRHKNPSDKMGSHEEAVLVLVWVDGGHCSVVCTEACGKIYKLIYKLRKTNKTQK